MVSSTDKTVKLWKVSERDKRPEGYNLKDEEGRLRDPATITTLRVSLSVSLATRVGGSLATHWLLLKVTTLRCEEGRSGRNPGYLSLWRQMKEQEGTKL